MASVDMFLKIDSIDGESADDKHKGEIDIESYSFGAAQHGTFGTAGGGGAGKVSLQDFHFVMKISKASPKLFLACASGQHIPSALLTVRKAGGDQQEFFKAKFSDVLVASFQTGGAGGSDIIPTEQISLNFAKLEVEYKEQKKDGTLGPSVKAGWDAKANKKV